jgi:predicted component of type VI protein secretion system
LGREEITGERAYAHIQLHEKTVSRKQAEILSDNGKLIIKNLSTTNYTMVDGKELLPGVTAELKPNTVFKVGEVEIRYKN